jgi:dipeptidyl aminopeptidase/acylaminoacyl peptidase
MAEGIERVNLVDGRKDLIAKVKYADSLQYSNSGKLLGILAAIIEDSPAASEADADEPDCRGGIFALYVQQADTKPLLRIPFPKGFESVLDYAFSPDDRSIAVTFGAAACDYPGDVARVYLVSLPDLAMRPISPAGRLSVKAQWSPDGRLVVYSDYNGAAPPLVVVDVRSGQSSKLTSDNPDGPDEILGWYRR